MCRIIHESEFGNINSREDFMSHLDELENEAIHVLREAWAQFDKPVILFSGGKDSIVVTHLAQKAFFPGKIPFALLHIDTGHNFPETIKFRDALVERLSLELIVGSVQESIDKARVVDEIGRFANRNALQTTTLLDTIAEQKIDCAIVVGVMKRRPGQKSDSFHIEIALASGGPKNRGLNYGIFSMGVTTRVNISGFFP